MIRMTISSAGAFAYYANDQMLSRRHGEMVALGDCTARVHCYFRYLVIVLEGSFSLTSARKIGNGQKVSRGNEGRLKQEASEFLST